MKKVPSEFQMDLCFIHNVGDANRFVTEIRREMERLFHSGARWYLDSKKVEQLDIAVVEVSGLTVLDSEEEVLQDLEARMDSDCWDWLNGYRLAVIPKEDAGSCRLHRKRGSL